MGEVYRLDFPSGKSYIGATTQSAAKRFLHHRSKAKKSQKGIIYDAWRKEGPPKCKVLAIVENKDLPGTERRAVIVFNTKHPNGYNFIDGGNRAPSLDPIVAKKISDKLTGRSLSLEHRDAIAKGGIGRKTSIATIEKIAASQKGKSVSQYSRNAMSKAHQGIPLSEERKAKMAIAQRARRAREKAKNL